MSAADVVPSVDGRNLRARTTRTKLVASCRELMLDGDFQPAMVAVAHRAGLSVRSCFQHFGSAGGLHLAALDDDIERAILSLVLGAAPTCAVERRKLARAIVLGRAG